jgi:hypothetical protein
MYLPPINSYLRYKHDICNHTAEWFRENGRMNKKYCPQSTRPPSTTKVVPVMKEASSEHSHTTALATSLASPMKPRARKLNNSINVLWKI